MINSWQGRTASGLESADRSAPAEPAAESCHPPERGTLAADSVEAQRVQPGAL